MTVVLLLTLAGCTTKYDLTGSDWTKPGTMIQQTTQDEIDCVRDAREAGSTPDLIVGGLADVARVMIEESQRRDSYKRCMTARGYRPT